MIFEIFSREVDKFLPDCVAAGPICRSVVDSAFMWFFEGQISPGLSNSHGFSEADCCDHSTDVGLGENRRHFEFLWKTERFSLSTVSLPKAMEADPGPILIDFGSGKQDFDAISVVIECKLFPGNVWLLVIFTLVNFGMSETASLPELVNFAGN